MEIIKVQDYKELSKKAAGIIAEQIKKNSSVLCFSTGATPLGMYKELVKMDLDFSKVTAFNLDEFVGLGKGDKESYCCYMFHNFFDHINIKKENINILDGKAEDLNKECEMYEAKIKQEGIDLLFLGIGLNGHIGMNEPGTSFSSETHVVDISEKTKEQIEKNFEDKEIPSQAMTMGIKTIMGAKKIVLLASGKSKAKIISRLIKESVTYGLPASVLKSHKNFTLLLDKAATKMDLGYQ